MQEFPAVPQNEQTAAGKAAGQLLQAQSGGILLIPAVAQIMAIVKPVNRHLLISQPAVKHFIQARAMVGCIGIVNQ
jgi:hypothetical protein